MKPQASPKKGPFPVVGDFDCRLFDHLKRLYREVKRGARLDELVRGLDNPWLRQAHRDGLLTEAGLRGFFEDRSQGY
ncbi:hypothetical protein [Acanthopleuribacter pedis]|uniref:Uncharacterized protein n=1 Tax=Acanthopleuribacter pedis TaxID=442870 RepID=A0A8J7QJX3_9BACT|nr:hypothetical protein [Acanthopleuribacter pedis]MBO1319598.1 hypothetical protein [Acanthopleuribacter pedis]